MSGLSRFIIDYRPLTLRKNMSKFSLFCCLALCMVQESIQKPIGYGFDVPMWMYNYFYSSYDYPPSVDDNNG